MNDAGTALREDLMPGQGRRAFTVLLRRAGDASRVLSSNAVAIELPTAILLRADEVIE
jgi:hypothetical protein